jgi:hypothetical protein
MLSHRYGTERVYSPAARNDDREDRGGRGYLFPGFVRQNLTGIHFAGHRLCDSKWDIRCPRVIAIDHHCPQWNGLLEQLSHLGLNEPRLLRKCISIEIHLLSPLVSIREHHETGMLARIAFFDGRPRVERFIYYKQETFGSSD